MPDLLARLALAPTRERAVVLAKLQSGIGNASLARRLSSSASVVVQREETDDRGAEALDAELDPADAIELQQAAATVKAAAPAAPPPAAKRPFLTTLTNNCADCNAAAAILNAGTYVGEANVLATAGGQAAIRTTKAKKGWVAAIDVNWSIDVSMSTMEVTDFVWPNMTDAEKAAVAAFKAALLAHEEGHFGAIRGGDRQDAQDDHGHRRHGGQGGGHTEGQGLDRDGRASEGDRRRQQRRTRPRRSTARPSQPLVGPTSSSPARGPAPRL